MALRSDIYSNLALVEPNGRTHVVRQASRRRLTLLQSIGLQPITVDLELEETGQIGLDQLKERVVAAMNASPNIWEATVGKDITDWHREVRDQPTIRHLIELVLLP
jgi:hypothetical protein